MRSFKHISKIEDKELRSLFPTLILEELEDDESIIKIPISFWSKWYADVENKENVPVFDCDAIEERSRYKKLYGLAADIVRDYEVFGIFYNRNKIKKVRCKEQLIQDLEGNPEYMRPLLIPELNAIYCVTYDFTAFIYCKSESNVVSIMEKANEIGLKRIEYT